MSPAPPSPGLPSPARRAQREALHRAFLAAERLIGPSQLAWLQGAPRQWSEAEWAALWAKAAARQSPDAHNNVYLHVPLCKSICSFCNYERLRAESPEAITAWRDRVLASIEAMAPAVQALTFRSLYVGGGTPSVLPTAILREVLGALNHKRRWSPGARRCIELDPAVIRPDKVAAMVDQGMQHFSFGVQTLNAAVNLAHNRGPQGEATVLRCLEMLPGPLEATVQLDLLLGLAGVSPAQTLADLAVLLAHPRRPSIDLFFLSPTPSYVAGHFGGDSAAARAALSAYDADFSKAVAALARAHGYRHATPGSQHCHSLHPTPWSPPALRALGAELRQPGALRRGLRRGLARLRRGSPLGYTQLSAVARAPLNLLGFGPSARSQLFGHAAVQTRPAAGEAGPTTYEGAEMSLRDELRAFLVFDVRDNHAVDDDVLRRIFGMTLAEALPEALAVWVERGFAQPRRGGWRFAALPPAAMAEALLWAVPDAALQGLIDARRAPRAG
jgi:coproporphyrinogen III oxidase-like Fe-S oxidoreductase